MDLKIKKLIFEANGFYQDCCDADTICFEEKNLIKFVELLIRESEESEDIDFITVQNLLEYFGFLNDTK
jgi:hypothetical protein|nr:MAG: hypothetical protein [Caudoviricetes sp.]